MTAPHDESDSGARDEAPEKNRELPTDDDYNYDDREDRAAPKDGELLPEDKPQPQHEREWDEGRDHKAREASDSHENDSKPVWGESREAQDGEEVNGTARDEPERASTAAHRDIPEDPVPSSGMEHPGANGEEPVNLFVRNVAKHVMEHQLVDLFSKYGKVESAVVVRDPHSKECRGFGFVKMHNEDAAKRAIEALQEFDFEGRKISVERAKRNAPHSRTPGAYMGIDRRIRDRYAGMKRAREHDGGRYPYGPPYDARGPGYRGRYDDPGRPRYEDRAWDNRGPYDGPPGYDDRDRMRRRYNNEGPRYPPTRDFERDQRLREREPPVPRESADDYI